MKKTIAAFCIGLVICFCISVYMDSTQAALADGVIRLHVVANSDSDEDQKLKLKVRDRILNELGNDFSSDKKIDIVREEIAGRLEYIKKIAEDEIKLSGYNYSAQVSFEKCEFPRKVYGNITLPAGEYKALKVNIGDASGKNWWCVLFPPLCFVDEACVSVSNESKEMLKNQVGNHTYNMISSKGADVEFRLKSYELWQKGKKTLADCKLIGRK